MAKLLVLYYSTWGHVEAMAHAVAEGARAVPGVEVTIKRVPETIPTDVAQRQHYKLDQAAPIASHEELDQYDGIVFGTSTRFGSMAGQMRSFLDRTGGLWLERKLVGKVGSVFVATGTQHGGQETAIVNFHQTLIHHGMVIVGLPYSFPGLLAMDQITGGSPYGASTLASYDGSRTPSANELAGAKFQGQHVARVTLALKAAGISSPNEATAR